MFIHSVSPFPLPPLPFLLSPSSSPLPPLQLLPLTVTQQTMAPDSPTLQALALSPPTTPTPSCPNPLLTSFRELLISEDGNRQQQCEKGRPQDVHVSMDDTIGESSELYTTAMSTSENTSLLASDSSPHPSDHTHESNTTPETVSDTAGASMSPNLLDCSYAANITVPIPPSLHKLSNADLRERLIHLGEQPGPITNFTRPAYLTYLAKLEAGRVRPQEISKCDGEPQWCGLQYPCALSCQYIFQ